MFRDANNALLQRRLLMYLFCSAPKCGRRFDRSSDTAMLATRSIYGFIGLNRHDQDEPGFLGAEGTSIYP
jgi:hypothetical protein